MGSSTLTFKVGEESLAIQSLKENFQIISESADSLQKIISRLEILKEGSKIYIIFYSTGKCLIQGGKDTLVNEVKTSLVSRGLAEIKKEAQAKFLAELNENDFYREKNFIVGFDEAGIGETIGSSIFVGVILPKEKLSIFKNIRKDIKSLSEKELNYYCNLIKDKDICFEYVTASPQEFNYCGFTKNRLMDKKYVELIRKLAPRLNKEYILMLDNYGVKEDITEYLERLDKQGIRSICRDKLDENITACKLASIIARNIRYSEIRVLEQNNKLEYNGQKISFGKGATNEQTETWLLAFRQLNPTLDFPDFVKKNWANVEKIETKLPRKVIPLSFNCFLCQTSLKRIYIYHTKETDSLRFYCTKCELEIDKSFLRRCTFPYLLPDTNSLVSGTISQELKCQTSVFNGAELLIPHKIIDEIDTIGKTQRNGALAELERLKELETNGKIKLRHCDFELTHPFDADKKLYDLIAKKNSCALITADRNLAINAQANDAFVFHVINYVPQRKV